MPSIFNHDNACWGVRRSFCNVFQYELNEDLQERKLTEFGISPDTKNLVQNINPVHYSVSSNGYYGYQPHTVIHNYENDNNAMDIEDNTAVASPVQVENVNEMNFSALSSNHHHVSKRKRHLPIDCVDNKKKMRQEEATEVAFRPTIPETPRMEPSIHPKCLMGHFL